MFYNGAKMFLSQPQSCLSLIIHKVWSTTFLRAFRRLIRKRSDLRKKVEDVLILLVQDPFIPQLETHKLKGILSGSWACSVGYDFRVIFDFVKNKKKMIFF